MPPTSKYNWPEIEQYYTLYGFAKTCDKYSIPEPTLAKHLVEHPEIPRRKSRTKMRAHSTTLTDDYPEPDMSVEPEEESENELRIKHMKNFAPIPIKRVCPDSLLETKIKTKILCEKIWRLKKRWATKYGSMVNASITKDIEPDAKLIVDVWLWATYE